jgi:hypothetical protein
MTSSRTANIAPGATGAASLTVSSQASTVPGFYTVDISSINSASASYATTASATIAVATSFTAQVTSDALIYTRPKRRNQTYYAAITTMVSSGSAAVSGAAITVNVKDPAGNVTALTGTTDASGAAVASYPIRTGSAVGSYAVVSIATLGSMSSQAIGGFTVQ